jgi:GT2 family glycosyltransferase
MTDKKIRVEIVTPVHNRRDITLQCLRSLRRLNTKGLEVHTIIVDDGSTDGTSEAIEKEFPEVELIRADGSLFFTEGTNEGVRAALKHNPKYVLMMNDDQVFDADFLKFMVETAERNSRSVVGSLLLLWDTPHKLFQVAPMWDTLAGGWRHWSHQTIWTIPQKPFEVDLIVGNCVLVPVEAIRQHGLMNSKRYPNFGDAEYTPRLRKNGWRLLIDPRARVFCQPNNIPARVSHMNTKQKFNALFVDLRNIHNLRRRFFSYWDGAPTRWRGILSFMIFFARLILKKNIERAEYAKGLDEKPLAEIFAKAQVED